MDGETARGGDEGCSRKGGRGGVVDSLEVVQVGKRSLMTNDRLATLQLGKKWKGADADETLRVAV